MTGESRMGSSNAARPRVLRRHSQREASVARACAALIAACAGLWGAALPAQASPGRSKDPDEGVSIGAFLTRGLGEARAHVIARQGDSVSVFCSRAFPADRRVLPCAFPDEPPGVPVYRESEEDGAGGDSEFLTRGRRDPWIAAIASLVLPGAGQVYNSAAPHAFVLDGYTLGLCFQAGAHALVSAFALFNQFEGVEVEYPGGGGPHVLNERDAQTWRAIHAINALLAAATAWLEALWVNEAGKSYVARMRMQAFRDEGGTGLGVEVGVSF